MAKSEAAEICIFNKISFYFLFVSGIWVSFALFRIFCVSSPWRVLVWLPLLWQLFVLSISCVYQVLILSRCQNCIPRSTLFSLLPLWFLLPLTDLFCHSWSLISHQSGEDVLYRMDFFSTSPQLFVIFSALESMRNVPGNISMVREASISFGRT